MLRVLDRSGGFPVGFFLWLKTSTLILGICATDFKLQYKPFILRVNAAIPNFTPIFRKAVSTSADLIPWFQVEFKEKKGITKIFYISFT